MELEEKIYNHLAACENDGVKGDLSGIRLMCGSELEETIAALRKMVNQGKIEPMGNAEQPADGTCGLISADTIFRIRAVDSE